MNKNTNQEKVLKHIVLFGFKDEISEAQLNDITDAFSNLPNEIDLIKSFEWGTDISPEGKQRGHTHAFVMSFSSEKDRDDYLIHPTHQEFGKLVDPALETVTVIDYWT